MLDELKKQFTSIQILITLLIIAVSIYILQVVWQFVGNFSDVLVVLICAWLLSFVLEPFVERIMHLFRMSKTIAAFIVYAAFFALLMAIVFSFIPIVTSQIEGLVTTIPRYITTVPPFLNHWIGFATSYLDNSLPIISSVAAILFDLLLVFIISFYFIVDRDHINDEMYNLMPKKWHPHITFIQELIDSTFASYIRIQLMFGILSGVATWAVLRLFNVNFAASTAVLSGILTIIPMIGPILAIIPPLILPLLTNVTQAIFIFLVLLIFQQIIFNIIGPKILSKAVKLHPVIVLLSFLIGYKLAGGIGAIFAIPVFGICAVLLHRISHHFLHHEPIKSAQK